MKTPLSLLTFALLLITSTAVSAGGEVGDSTWYGGGMNVTFDVGGDGGQNDPTVTINATNSSGTSSTVPGGDGPNSTMAKPTCDVSDVMTMPDGSQVRIKGGKPERKAKNGKWVQMRKKAEKKKRSPGRSMHLEAGELAPWDGSFTSPTFGETELFENDPAPWSGMLTSQIGEEGTSLPGGP